MLNIGSLLPPVSTPKIGETTSRDAAVAGTEINKDPQQLSYQCLPRKRRDKKDRRRRNIKPLMDLRISRDRRLDPDVPSIDIKI
ncbi:MAG: hypothetical protein ACJAUP_001554 [Cellvibrionaceae bacterium]|jgi:hypothetical protein